MRITKKNFKVALKTNSRIKSQHELAKELSIAEEYLSRIVNSRVALTNKMVRCIADALQVPESFLTAPAISSISFPRKEAARISFPRITAMQVVLVENELKKLNLDLQGIQSSLNKAAQDLGDSLRKSLEKQRKISIKKGGVPNAKA